ncbi:hypothetical protein JVX95_30840 [Mycolicibacterium septicum]|nr:hypothetical protein JVX95_30840 [Mycolicibacterium septicum]
MVAASVSFIGANGSQTTSVTIPTHQVGDLIVIFAAASNSAVPTAPSAGGTVPAWATVDSGATTIGVRTATFVATATNHTSGTWGSTGMMLAVVLRGQAASGYIGGHARSGGGGSSTPSAPSVTMVNTDGTSVLLHFYSNPQISGTWSSPASGYTNQVAIGTTNQKGVCLNTKDVTTSDGSVTQGPAAGLLGYGSASIEICSH